MSQTKHFILASVLALAAGAQPVFAESAPEGDSAAAREALRERRQERREAHQEQRQKRFEQAKQNQLARMEKHQDCVRLAPAPLALHALAIAS